MPFILNSPQYTVTSKLNDKKTKRIKVRENLLSVRTAGTESGAFTAVRGVINLLLFESHIVQLQPRFVSR